VQTELGTEHFAKVKSKRSPLPIRLQNKIYGNGPQANLENLWDLYNYFSGLLNM